MTSRLVTLALATVCLLCVGQATVRAVPEIKPVGYDLGQTTITQAAFDPGSRFHEMPVALRGVIAAPDGPGPYPVAVFMHGAYPFCEAPGVDPEVDAYPCPAEADLRQFEGFHYLVQALAERGYVAIAPDLSAEFNNGFGEATFGERSSQIIEANLDALADGDGFGIDVSGKADLDRVGVVGHSRGGSLALRYVHDVPAAADSVAALVLLTPAYLAPDAPIPGDLATALVIAECDSDVGTEQPLLFVDQLPPLRHALATTLTLPGGTHEAFSTQLVVRPSPACDPAHVLPAEQQQAWAATFLPDFLDLALGSIIEQVAAG